MSGRPTVGGWLPARLPAAGLLTEEVQQGGAAGPLGPGRTLPASQTCFLRGPWAFRVLASGCGCVDLVTLLPVSLRFTRFRARQGR